MAKPMRPEIKFFLNSHLFKQGTDFYLKKYFSNPAEKILGEKGTSYIEHQDAGKRINDHFPNAKIIIILRNPVKRALSNYFFSVMNGLETRTPEEVFLKNSTPPKIETNTSVDPFNYLGRGEYKPYIEKYIEIFGQEKIQIYCLEKISSAISELQKVYHFLGATKNFEPVNFDNNVNTTEGVYPVSPEVIRKLQRYYREKNDLLNDYVDTSCWSQQFTEVEPNN